MRHKIRYVAGAWKLYHLGGSPWQRDFTSASEAYNALCDAIAANWLKYHEWYRYPL